MNRISVNYTLIYELSTDNKYKWTKCGKCFNTKTGRELRKRYNSGCIGYYINGKFKSLTALRKQLVKIKETETPF